VTGEECYFLEPNDRTVPNNYRLLGRLLDGSAPTEGSDALPLYSGNYDGGGGETWRAGKIVSREDPDGTDGARPSYTVQPLGLNGDGEYVAVGDAVGPCYRMPSEDRDEHPLPILVEIPVGQGVLWREDPDRPGVYQMTPWGGLKRSVIEHLYRVCAQCVNVGGVFKIRAKNAIRHIGEYSRDRRALWMQGNHGEENLENNTELQIDPE
jgi:hypothetical protein